MPLWVTIFLALGGSTLISLIVTTIWKYAERKVQAKAEAEALRKEEEKKAEDARSREELKRAVIELIAPLADKIDGIKEELLENKKATITTLRSSMKSLRDKYTRQGYADYGDKATWRELYNDYKDMGGNHFKEYVDGWKDEIEKLPSSPSNRG